MRQLTLVRADSRFVPSQWETALFCNDVSHWLGASLESVLLVQATASRLFNGWKVLWDSRGEAPPGLASHHSNTVMMCWQPVRITNRAQYSSHSLESVDRGQLWGGGYKVNPPTLLFAECFHKKQNISFEHHIQIWQVTVAAVKHAKM